MCADLFDVPISFSFKPSSQKTHLLPLQAVAAQFADWPTAMNGSQNRPKKRRPQPSTRAESEGPGPVVRGPIPSAAGTRPGLKLMGPVTQYHRRNGA